MGRNPTNSGPISLWSRHSTQPTFNDRAQVIKKEKAATQDVTASKFQRIVRSDENENELSRKQQINC